MSCNSCCDNPQIIWDADICLNVCTSCGDAVEHALVGPSAYSTGNQVGRQNSRQTAIKSKHGPVQHTLNGESSEHKAKRYTAEMRNFISSLCAQMSNPNLTARVCLLFDQSMKNELANFRWGGQAKAVSGACLAVALRESNKPDRLKEIALLLGQKYVYLQRTLATLLASLNIKLPSTTPSHHIPNLVSHLYKELRQRPEDSMLNVKLYSQLQDISLQAVAELSCAFLETFAMTSKSKFIQSSSSSCAVSAFVICLEGELRKSLFEITDIFKYFSQICHLSSDTLARPYRVMRQEVLKWMKDLNWEEQYKKGSNGRADSSLRNVCARSLKDALREIDQRWRVKQRTIPGQNRVHFALDDDVNSGEESPDDDVLPETGRGDSPFKFKNKKVDSCILDGATFLLHPFHHLPKGLTAPIRYPHIDWSSVSQVKALSESPLETGPRANSSEPKSKSLSKLVAILPVESSANSKEFYKALNYSADQFSTDPEPCDYMNYLLSCDEPILAIRANIHEKVTRMSLQTAALGAADAEAIPDEALLTNEEWQTLQRTAEEQEQLQEYWNNVPGLMDRMEKNAERAKETKYEHLSGIEEDERDLANQNGVVKIKKLKLFEALDLVESDLDTVDGEDSFEQSLGLGMDMESIMRLISGNVGSDEEFD